jgi:hypothetical protein
MSVPFIHLSQPDAHHYAERSGKQGIEVVREQGTHAFFVVKVPHIPAMMGSEFTRTVSGADTSRVALITRRQIRFVADLLNARSLSAEGAVAVCLRYLVTPASTPGDKGRVEVVFIGKVFHPNQRCAVALCRDLWRKFIAHFPSEDPFNYPLFPVGEADLLKYLHPLTTSGTSLQLQEIRKFEDSDPYAGDHTSPVGYFAHPFAPTHDATALGRFIETLAQQEQRCVVNICLQPTELFQHEVQAIHQLVANYARVYKSAEPESWLHTYRKERMEDLQRTYWPLINARKHLFKIGIQIIGEQAAPDDVAEALGSELIENTFTSEPRHWTRERPTTDAEALIAWQNFNTLELQPWGRQRLDPSTTRLRFLVSAYEATGAFRLPIPPEHGYLPGIEVREEPFFMPHKQTKPETRSITLGEILHRGQPTGRHVELPVQELLRHCLIAGATGAGKTNTCLWLLSQLWKQHQIPFLVMYPVAKRDYRVLLADQGVRNDLLIFTLGAENVAPFRFNPFAVADGVPLRTHMSLLMRCFSAAFSFWDPLTQIYRASIRKVYERFGWDLINGVGGLGSGRTPTLADFYDTIVAVALEMTKDYGSEVRGNARQGSEIRIRELLERMGPVMNVAEAAPIAEVLRRPTVMELGMLGEAEDKALVMAFLLVLLFEQVQSNVTFLDAGQRSKHIHVTLLEEAHQFMPANPPVSNQFVANPRAAGSEDLSNLLAEWRGFGEGVLIAEQIPTDLIQGAIGNTYLKIMHRLEDQPSFDLFSAVMNLNDRQKIYARTLERGCAIVRDQSGHPIHVQVSNYLDTFQDVDDRTIVDDSDNEIRKHMHGRMHIPPTRVWSLTSRPDQVRTPVDILPEPLAQYCSAPQSADVFTLPQVALDERLPEIGDAADTQQWQRVRDICLEQLVKYGLEPDPAMARCYLARVASLIYTKGQQANERIYDAFPSCRAALENFPL